MPFNSRRYASPDASTSTSTPAARLVLSLRSVGGVGRGVTVLALVIAAALTGGLAWNLFTTQSRAREVVRETTLRRAALTADLIGSAFMAASAPAQALAEFRGPPRAVREAVRTRAAASKRQRVTVLDAGGRVLAAAGEGSDPQPSGRRDVRLALRGTPAFSDGFQDERGRWVVEVAVPFPSRWGRRVLLVWTPVDVVQNFTNGFFSTASPFRGTLGYLIDGTGRILGSRQPSRDGVPGPLWAALERGATGTYGDRTAMSAVVSSSRWRVVFSVPNAVLYASVRSPARAAWLLFAAFMAALCALLTVGSLAARGARRLAAATERERAASALAHERLHDPLTGLPNRTLFATRAERAVAAARRHGRTVLVVFMDIDHYKRINDSLGHELGDEVLREIARRLTRSVREADTVSRFGGDEFVVLCEDVGDGAATLAVVQRIRAGLHGPVDAGGRRVPVSFSIGVATGGAGGAERTAAELVADADAAMYRAKELGRGRVEIYDAQLHRQALTRLEAEVALRRAVEEQQFVLHYQPIMDLARGEVYGVEALVRWCRPEAEAPVGPSEFIGLAEEIGVIGAIGEWVLRTATAEISDWVTRGVVSKDFVLSVNVSARQLADPRLPEQVTEALTGWKRPADRLWLEVTETAVMADPAVSERSLTQLHALGVRLALDDFGSGYSSLGQLERTLPMSVLKLDRSFVAGMSGQPDGGVVAAAATLAEALELSSVAEGVESAEQASELTAMGFTYGQGFYFGAPAEAEEAVRRLGSGRFVRHPWMRSIPR
jgi:diguanylate cyclase (GGDEF)-like protein